MAKSILEEAMEDAALLKKTAIENAKNVLVEAISPKIKEFVNSQLGEMDMMPEMGQMQLPAGFIPEAGMYEKHEDEPEDLELLRKLGLQGAESEDEEEKEESEDEDEEMEEQDMNVMMPGMAESEIEEGEELQEADEVVEITDADLKEALSEVLGNIKSEAKVSKGFADASTPDKGGLMDKKSGEKHWSDEEAPASQDWTVKEAAYRKKVEILATEVNKLRRENREFKEACSYLKRNLQEVNLFNSKLLYTNKVLHGAKLNNEQRLNIIEAFDRAQSLREVELVYKSLSESLKIAGVLGESRQARTMKGPKGSRYTTPSSTVLKESVDRENNGDSFTSRMQELAGLVE